MSTYIVTDDATNESFKVSKNTSNTMSPSYVDKIKMQKT